MHRIEVSVAGSERRGASASSMVAGSASLLTISSTPRHSACIRDNEHGSDRGEDHHRDEATAATCVLRGADCCERERNCPHRERCRERNPNDENQGRHGVRDSAGDPARQSSRRLVAYESLRRQADRVNGSPRTGSRATGDCDRYRSLSTIDAARLGERRRLYDARPRISQRSYRVRPRSGAGALRPAGSGVGMADCTVWCEGRRACDCRVRHRVDGWGCAGLTCACSWAGLG